MRDGVVGPRRRLGVILDSEHRQGAVPDSLDRPVIQVHVCDFEVARSRDSDFVAVYRKTMILCCDQHATTLHFLHRMVSASMAVRELSCRAAERKSEKLMSEANSENGRAAGGEVTHRVGGIVDCIRISGAIRQKDSVRPCCQRLGRGRVGGNHCDSAVMVREQSQNVALDPVVVGDDVSRRSRITPGVTLSSRHPARQVEPFHRRTLSESLGSCSAWSVAEAYHASHHP